MGNFLAYGMLVCWPLVTAALFSRMPIPKAMVWTVVAGYLALPDFRVAFKISMLPTYDRTFAPAAAALLFCLLYDRAVAGRRWLPSRPLALGLVCLFIVAPILTTLANSDPVFVGGRVIPGLRLYDAGNFMYRQLTFIIPFLLAYRYLGDDRGQELLARALVLGALAYSVLMLIEIRISPQLHDMVYGFRHFSFRQSLREGGWRPVVFLNHGLWTVLFLSMGFVAAAGLARAAVARMRLFYHGAAAWMGCVLLLSNSLGALVLGVIFAAMARFAPVRVQIIAGFSVAVFVLSFPMLRSADLVPVDRLTEMAASVSEARAQSLQFRFDNEDILLAKANSRPLTGWGGWGRSRVYDEETGEDVSVTDGRWIITFGVYGWLGYIAEYGLLTLPLLAAMAARRRFGSPELFAVLAMTMSVNLIDLIPNGTLTPITWLLAGAMLGRAHQKAPALARRPHYAQRSPRAGPAASPAPAAAVTPRAPAGAAAPPRERAAPPLRSTGRIG